MSAALSLEKKQQQQNKQTKIPPKQNDLQATIHQPIWH
jgi:hypothetical protein